MPHLESLDSERAQGSVGLFGALPVEVIENILNCVVEDDPYLVNAPVVGDDGVAVDPSLWLSTSARLTRVSNPTTSNGSTEEFDQNEQQGEGDPETRPDINMHDQSTVATPNQDLYSIEKRFNGSNSNPNGISGLSALRNLRLTCRYLNNLCNVVLYREVDMNFRDSDFISTAGEEIQQYLLRPHGHHISTLRIQVVNWDKIPSILTACTNLRCLALYLGYDMQYNNCTTEALKQTCNSIVHILQGDLHDAEATTTGGNDEVGQERERGRENRLVSLGIYSESIVKGLFNRNKWVPYAYDSAQRLLLSILDTGADSDSTSSVTDSDLEFNANINNASKGAKLRDTIQVLDLATDCMQATTYNQIRGGFPNLRSLAIRRSLHIRLGKIWDPVQSSMWALNTPLKHSLRRLYLRDCDNVAAWHVPGLVGHFTRLEEVVIVACGNDNYVPPRRLAGLTTASTTSPSELGSGLKPGLEDGGWSTLPNALCNSRPPLRTFHIEHMDEDEITAMGIIPVHTLSIISRQLIRLLLKDREIFPKLKVLRTYPGTKQDPPGIPMTVPTAVIVPATSTDAQPGEGSTENGGGLVADEGAARRNPAEEYLRTILQNLCKARGIELRYDLPRSTGCGPGCGYI